MSDVNDVNYDLIGTAARDGRRMLRCCCHHATDPGQCLRCRPTNFAICCLQASRTDWVEKIHFVETVQAVPWEIGDPCTSGCTNLCGSMVSLWNTGTCRRQYYLEWSVLADCTTVRMTISADDGEHADRHETSATVTVDIARDWYLSPLVIDDPYYKWRNSLGDPDYPSPVKQLTIGSCPVPTVILPAVTVDPVQLRVIAVRRSDGYILTATGPEPPATADNIWFGRGKGNDVCGHRYWCSSEELASSLLEYAASWVLLPDLATVRVTVWYRNPGGGDLTTDSGWVKDGELDVTWSDDWFESVITIPSDSAVVVPVDYIIYPSDCFTTGGCVAVGCLPTCIQKMCGAEFSRRPVYLHVTGCACLADAAPSQMPTNDGGGIQSGTFGDGVTCPTVQINYSCGAGGLYRTVTVTTVGEETSGGFVPGTTTTYGPTLVSAACSGDEWSDSVTIDIPGCGSTTFDLFSDSADPWEVYA